ncbi:hypothetical protein Dda_3986 [Drechslerella dactyloides]|uniref:Phytocyanin domain-containing protein n=1 Tax=Drechslerella dactyloides TaxID=74499 RepID=A0AAD6IZS3_DREDA|nr:hypothetical protein Dda_3986 [Drechslerella dactyloides]
MRYIIVLSALTAAASAATIDVQISGLTFSPDSITAAVGDVVSFKFAGGNHTVTQSAFDDPCNPLANGISSGWTGSSSETFSITITSTDPIYFFCAAPGHCNAGMVGAINPPTNGNTLAAYKSASEGAEVITYPGGAYGGVVSVQGGAVSTAPGAGAAPSGAAPTLASNSSAPVTAAGNASAPVTAAGNSSAPAVTAAAASPVTIANGNSSTILTLANVAPASSGLGNNSASATIAVIGPSITGNFTGTLPTPPPAIGGAVTLAGGLMTVAMCVLGAMAFLA